MTPRHSSSPSVRPKLQANSRLEKNLVAYVTAATAAGVAMMAAAPPAAAEVVYTRTHVTIGADSTYALDINHDGVADFTLIRCGSCVNHASILLVGFEAVGNQVIVGAPALSARSPIGPGQNFNSSTFYGGVQMVDAGSYSAHSWFFGAWANQTNKYLGLKFLIGGQVHYGWARLTVTPEGSGRYTAVLTGYAYETTPNRGIPAGLQSGPTSEAAPGPVLGSQPPSLGMLARGADALPLWRREER
jgi:hypothetical protein